VRVQTVEDIFWDSWCLRVFALGLRWLDWVIFHFLLILDGDDGNPGALPSGGGANLRCVGGLASELLLIIAYHCLIQVVGDPIQIVIRVRCEIGEDLGLCCFCIREKGRGTQVSLFFFPSREHLLDMREGVRVKPRGVLSLMCALVLPGR